MRKSLWFTGVTLALCLLTFTIGNFVVPEEKAIVKGAFAQDFLAFYTAGTFVRTGRSAELYDLKAVGEFQKSIAESQHIDLGPKIAPWWNPPFYALLFVPFSLMNYHAALAVWEFFNLLLAIGAIILLCRMLIRPVADDPAPLGQDARDWRTWALVPLLLLVSMPSILTWMHGQNGWGSLLIVAGAVTLWRQRRAWAAGIVLGLLLYKPQLAVVIALAMVLDLGWRALAGMAVTGLVLLALSLAISPYTLTSYIHELPANLRSMQSVKDYPWQRHVTFRAFWQLLLQGLGGGDSARAVRFLTLALVALFGTTLAVAAANARRFRLPWHTDRLIMAALVAAPLLMPFYFDYDLLLLAVPAVLLAREINAEPAPGAYLSERLDRWTRRFWLLLGVWLYINFVTTNFSQLNMNVPLLAILAVLHIRRLHPPVPEAAEAPAVPRPYPKL